MVSVVGQSWFLLLANRGFSCWAILVFVVR